MRGRRTKRSSKTNYFSYYLKLTSRILSILILLCLAIFIYSSINVRKNSKSLSNINTNESFDNNTSEINNETETIISENNTSSNIDSSINTSNKKSTTINMSLTGDIMCHNTIYNDAYSNRKL